MKNPNIDSTGVPLYASLTLPGISASLESTPSEPLTMPKPLVAVTMKASNLRGKSSNQKVTLNGSPQKVDLLRTPFVVDTGRHSETVRVGAKTSAKRAFTQGIPSVRGDIVRCP